mmetsp:Transcript_29624/g.79523  ORF Transcript_29624/g.79523 Transcript_29624/m.79523 type:complete len:200 (+) Transcript_29624:314-913(+)
MATTTEIARFSACSRTTASRPRTSRSTYGVLWPRAAFHRQTSPTTSWWPRTPYCGCCRPTVHMYETGSSPTHASAPCWAWRWSWASPPCSSRRCRSAAPAFLLRRTLYSATSRSSPSPTSRSRSPCPPWPPWVSPCATWGSPRAFSAACLPASSSTGPSAPWSAAQPFSSMASSSGPLESRPPSSVRVSPRALSAFGSA